MLPVLDSSDIVILQRDEAEGLNIQSAVIRPTSNFIANSPRLLDMRPDVHWHSRKGSREKAVKYEVWMLYYVQRAKGHPWEEVQSCLFLSCSIPPSRPFRNFQQT